MLVGESDSSTAWKALNGDRGLMQSQMPVESVLKLAANSPERAVPDTFRFSVAEVLHDFGQL